MEPPPWWLVAAMELHPGEFFIPDLVRTKETHMTKHQRFSNCLICFQDLTWLKHADAEGPRNDLGHTCHCKIKPWIWPFWICGSFKTWSFLFLQKYETCCSLLFVRKNNRQIKRRLLPYLILKTKEGIPLHHPSQVRSCDPLSQVQSYANCRALWSWFYHRSSCCSVSVH